MFLRLLKSKIHRATVTETKMDYSGSIAIDKTLMDAAGIVPYEKVLVANLANGTRHETYVVPAEADSGRICIMGAAAHLVNPADKVIIMAFADYTLQELEGHHPRFIFVDDDNKITGKK